MDPYKFDFHLASGWPSDEGPALDLVLPSNFPSPYYIAGVDEAGRGPLAGPVVAAAVILPPSPLIKGLRDSKTLPSTKREELYEKICEVAVATSTVVIEPHIIDAINIFAATMQAMRQAVSALKTKPHLIVIDGNQKPGCGILEMAIVKGDNKSAAIMAAGILAKVTRDRIMIEADKIYPLYGFAQHKGYGSKQHMEVLQKHGPCPLHRVSFEPVREALSKTVSLV